MFRAFRSLAITLALLAATSAMAGYSPFGWQGWLQSVATITDAPSSGVLTGSVVFAQDNDELYYWDGSEWTELSGGGGSGTVTSVSVVSANGFAGTVADATTTPAITMETSITGLLHGNGTAVAAETVSSPLNESSGTLSCLTASGSQAGCLSSTDWSTFNGKQASGNYITALTGDVSASGPGSAAATLATVNSDVGSYVCSDVTVNGKGLVTAAASGTSSDIIGLFSGCSGTDYLGADGACHTAAGTPGGSSSDVQYNSSGSFGGDSGMTYDGSGDLTLTGKVNATTALLSNLTASEIVESDASKNLISAAHVSAALGGTNIDTSSSTGCPLISSGTWSISSLLSCFQQLYETVATTTGDLIYGGSSGVPTRLAIGSTGQVLTVSGGVPTWANNGSVTAPNVTIYTSGSGTYTVPTSPSPLYLEVIAVGGGGGGGGGGTTSSGGDGGAGNNTTFGTGLIEAYGGGYGYGSGVATGGSGGSATTGSGPVGIAIPGGGGQGGSFPTGSASPTGGSGGSSALGGAGTGATNNAAGVAGATNSGAGGGGGSGGSTASEYGGGGGGSGGYVNAQISSPSSTYSYSVGSGGSGGSAGTSGQAGGNGASGIIVVTAYYQ